MNYYFDVLKKYAVFSGRSRRMEFWTFYLVNFLIAFGLSGGVGFFTPSINNHSNVLLYDLFTLLYLLYAIVIPIPGLAVTVRRLHDIGKSGWMALVSFIPLVGIIWLIILLATDGNLGENKYGPDPKGAATN